MKDTVITMAHGSGGSATGKLIEEVFAKYFNNEILGQMEDSAVVPGNGTIAMTTDSFVVTPLEFPGGNIGRLCICGTVNDLLMRGAIPKYITCGFILQEGLSLETLERVVKSMAETAKEAGVLIVAGDTKVVQGSGEMYINTAGVGFLPADRDISAKHCKEGDAILVSGNLGDHHGAILSSRMSITNHMESDNAPLTEMVTSLLEKNISIHTMRDVTRGGLATVLKELAMASGKTFELAQDAIPVTPEVKDFCGILGLDPLYMGNEGKMIVIVPESEADQVLSILCASKYGENAKRIGSILKENKKPGELLLKTPIGGVRSLGILQGEGLPRIC